MTATLPSSRSARLVLASQSPRRRELLARLLEGLNADWQTAIGLELMGPATPAEAAALEALEAAQPGEQPHDYVQRVALAKAHHGWQRLAASAPDLPVWLLASDTTVSVDDNILDRKSVV